MTEAIERERERERESEREREREREIPVGFVGRNKRGNRDDAAICKQTAHLPDSDVSPNFSLYYRHEKEKE